MFSKAVLLVIFQCFWIADMIGQLGKFVIEGTSDVSAVIHSVSGSSHSTALDLLNDNAFSGTDWRIINDGGIFRLLSATNNFTTPGNENFRLFNSGTMLLPRGSEASVGNLSGVLVVGNENGLNLALDGNEILARNNNTDGDLYIQSGTTGNTFMNGSGVI